MKLLRKINDWNREEKRKLRSTPNTDDEIRVLKKLRKKAKNEGITIIDELPGRDGGGYIGPGWKWKDIPEHTIKKHGYNKIIPKEMEGRPIISVVGNNKGKPFILAHELGHASPGNLNKNPNGKFGFRAKAEELRANIKGYQMLKKSGANKDTLKKARKGFYQQILGTLLAGHID